MLVVNNLALAPSLLSLLWLEELFFWVQVTIAISRFRHIQMHEEEKITLNGGGLRENMINLESQHYLSNFNDLVNLISRPILTLKVG